MLFLLIAAYLVGSLNAALIMGRVRGVDVRAVGSGNPGASNVYRSMGKGAAAVVYLFDLLKGFWPALVGVLVWNDAVGMAAGLLAVVGHCYPIYHRFRGGKGVATGGGVILGVVPIVLLALFVIYAVVVRLTKISSAGSLAAVASALPAAAVAGQRGWALLWLALALVLIVLRHRSNISRLLSGSENTVATS